jgi:PAS domain-containing protein
MRSGTEAPGAGNRGYAVPFADMDAGAWGWLAAAATGVAGLVGALSTAVVALIAARNKATLEKQAADAAAAIARAKADREDRTGTIAEWREIAQDLQQRLDASEKGWRERLDGSEKNWQARHDAQQRQIIGLMDAKSDCEKHVAELTGEVRLLQSSMQRVQEHTGTVPLPALPGLLIVGTDGVVRVASPAASAMFNLLPRDVEGQDVAEFLPELGPALKALGETEQPPWTERAVLVTGRRRGGGEFPAAVNLRGWQTGKEWLVRAEIRPRPGKTEPAEAAGRGAVKGA